MFNFLRNMFGLSERNATGDHSVIREETQLHRVSVTIPLPDDLIILILSYIPPDDLLKYCVCVEEWEPLIHSQSIWILKCQREGKALPAIRPNPIPQNFYQNLYFARFGKNLLRNPCGKESLTHWTGVYDRNRHYYSQDLLEGWVVEKPPEGADEVPDTDCQFCFSTTYYWCRKGQVIDLHEEGFPPDLIRSLKPKIYVGEWYCARFDCGSEYVLEVKLMDEKKEVVDSYHFYHKEDQWTGRAWSHAEHEFTDYPETVRYVYFVHSGKDTQYWAGNFGSKMAEGEVILKIQ